MSRYPFSVRVLFALSFTAATIKHPHIHATIERYTFKLILPTPSEEIMSSFFDPTPTKNADGDNTTHPPIPGEQPRQSGRWQHLAQKVPAPLLAILSVQMGAAVGKGLFSVIGPLGTTFLRMGFAAVLLLILWRAPIRGLTRTQ